MEFEQQTKKARDFIVEYSGRYNELAFQVNIKESLEQTDEFWDFLDTLHKDTPIVNSMKMTARVFNRIASNSLKTGVPRSEINKPALATGRVMLYIVSNDINSLTNCVELAKPVVTPFKGMLLPYEVWIPKKESPVTLATGSAISDTHLQILKDLNAQLPFQMRALARLEGDVFNPLKIRNYVAPLQRIGFGYSEDEFQKMWKAKDRLMSKNK